MECIKAIYLNEFSQEEDSKVTTGETRFSVNLLPATGDVKSEQFIKLTLRFEVPTKVRLDLHCVTFSFTFLFRPSILTKFLRSAFLTQEG